MEGWSCNEQNEEGEYIYDFDLCEQCIRWVIHSEKNKLDPGFSEETHEHPNEDRNGQSGEQLQSEPYLTERSHR